MITFEYVYTHNGDNSAVSKIRMEMPDDLTLDVMIQNYVTFLEAIGYSKATIMEYFSYDGLE